MQQAAWWHRPPPTPSAPDSHAHPTNTNKANDTQPSQPLSAIEHCISVPPQGQHPGFLPNQRTKIW
jgi:hypothetical protein